jgi:hypothetical protein
MFFLIIVLFFATTVHAQSIVMNNFATGRFQWDASANPKTTAGTTIPGTMKYQVWNKTTVPATVGTKVGSEITALEMPLTFVPYVESYPGVQAVFYSTATPTVAQTSTIDWSTDPAVCAGGVTFGILYLPTIDMIKNLRMVSP